MSSSSSSLGLFGRNDEAEALRDAYKLCFSGEEEQQQGKSRQHLCTQQERTPHLVLVHGTSGSGKSTLVSQTIPPLVTRDKGLFLTGKADATAQWSRPYQIFVSAFQQLIQRMGMDRRLRASDGGGEGYFPNDSSGMQEIRDALRKEFGSTNNNANSAFSSDTFSDAHLLSTIVPGFDKILHTASRTTSTAVAAAAAVAFPADRRRSFSSSFRSNNISVSSTSAPSKSKDSVARLRYLLHRLCRTISCQRPLVLFLDDIQWCDSSSLELLSSILSPKDGGGGKDGSILVVCAYRDDEFTSPSRVVPSMTSPTGNQQQENSTRLPLVDFLEEWQGPEAIKSMVYGVPVSDIPLHNVSESTLNEILSGVFGLPKIEFYSHLIHKVSSGNIYLALQCFRQLCEEGLLYRDEETHQWKWDFSQLQAQDDATAQFLLNPAFSDIVRHNITQLSPPAQYLLSVASCFGMEIEPDVLSVLPLPHNDDQDGKGAETSSDVDQLLEEANQAGLVVMDPIIGRYAFSHDRVQQAAHALIEDVNALSFHVGYQLWKKSPPHMLSAKIFTIANFLNKGQSQQQQQQQRESSVNATPDVLPENDIYGVADLNLEAGETAVSIAAFADATRYLERGVELLVRGGGRGGGSAEPTYWKEEYQLTLDLLSATAEVQVFHHNFERADKLIDEVCQFAKGFHDKNRVLMARIHAISLQGGLQEALKFSNEVLRELGESIPFKASVATIVWEQLRTMFLLRGKTNEDLLALPPMENMEKIAAANIVNTMFYFSWMSKSPHVMLLATKSIRLCLKHGTFAGSALSFALYGFIRCILGNVEEGFRFGELALQLLARDNSKDVFAFVHCIFYFGIHHHKFPLREGLDGLRRGAQVGLEVGDVDVAMLNDSLVVYHSSYMGCRLQEVEELVTSALRRRKIHEHPVTYNLIWVLSQTLDRLMGRTAYIGPVDFIEAVKLQTPRQQSSQLHIQESALLLHGAWLAYLFRDFCAAHQVARQIDRTKRKFNMSTTAGITMEWINGLVCVAMARDGVEKRRNLSNVKAILKHLAKRAQECPANRGHLYDVLKAEYDSLFPHKPRADNNNKKSDVVVPPRYISAMEKGLEEGFLQVAAVAAERAGDYLMRCGSVNAAQKYWSKAHSHYLEWGATAKAQSLSDFMRTAVTTTNS